MDDQAKNKKNNNKTSNIIEEKLRVLIGEKFGNYSRYIIQDRALPDINDGLKPVQRRILFSMYKLKMIQKNPYKKSARVVGDVIGKYHPHGDSSVYEALIRMAQEWKMNVPLIDMHGNKGSVDGDSAAAMRYTETRLQEIATHLIGPIEKNIVRMNPNFDDTELEPTVFPSLIPNLLINGSTGIASGFATNIPPHNFNEMIEGIIALLKNPEISIKEISKIIKGPDFPTGGSVENKKDILNYFKNGIGKIIIKSKINYDSKRNALIVTEIPYGVNKSTLVKKIDEIINFTSVSTIKEVVDETDKKGLQIAIHLKTGVNYESVISYLFKKTDLQKIYSVNMIAIKDRTPQLFSLMSYLTSFRDFTYKNYVKLYEYELNKILLRLEIVEGIIKAIPLLDEIIKLIRASKNRMEARENLIKRFGFSELQADAILNLKLYRLTNADIYDLTEEQNHLKALEKHYQKGLKNDSYLYAQIIKKLQEINEQFVIPRRSIIKSNSSQLTTTFDVKDLLQEEEVRITLSAKNNLKVLPQEEWNKSSKVAIDDLELFNETANNFSSLFVFTSLGKYYSIEIFKLVASKAKDMGINISSIFSLAPNESVLNILIAKEVDLSKNNYLLLATKNSLIKKIKYNLLSPSTSKTGVKLIKLVEEDVVVDYQNVSDDNGLLNVVTKNGYILRYPISNVSISSLSSQGITNIKLNEKDHVIGILVQKSKDIHTNEAIIFVSKTGVFKRLNLNLIRETSRARKGQKLTSEENPKLLHIFSETNTYSQIHYLSESFKSGTLIKKDLALLKSPSSKGGTKIDMKLFRVSDKSILKIEEVKTEKIVKQASPSNEKSFFNF